MFWIHQRYRCIPGEYTSRDQGRICSERCLVRSEGFIPSLFFKSVFVSSSRKLLKLSTPEFTQSDSVLGLLHWRFYSAIKPENRLGCFPRPTVVFHSAIHWTTPYSQRQDYITLLRMWRRSNPAATFNLFSKSSTSPDYPLQPLEDSDDMKSIFR